MSPPSPDNRSSEAKAYQWASRIMTLCLEMVVPGLLGYWLDQKLNTIPGLTVSGFALGMVMGIWHLIRIANSSDSG